MTTNALVSPALQLARVARDERQQHEILLVASVLIPTMGIGAVVGKITAVAAFKNYLFLSLCSMMFADVCLLFMAGATIVAAAMKAGLRGRVIFAALAVGLAFTYPVMQCVNETTGAVYSAYASTSPMTGLALDLLVIAIVNLLPPVIVAFGAQNKRVMQVSMASLAVAIVFAQTLRVTLLFF